MIVCRIPLVLPPTICFWLPVSVMICVNAVCSNPDSICLAQSIRWEVQRLTIDANEGIALADFNRDGRLDVVAGRNWYAAPDFVPRPVRAIQDWNGYVQSNGDYVWDVDQDGWPDVIAGSFLPSQVYWYRNPGQEALRLGQMWEKKLLVDTENSENEGQLLADLDQDGRPEWIVNCWVAKRPLLVWHLMTDAAKPTMKRFQINSTGNSHGLGAGDLDGDGDVDLLTGSGWFENPSSADAKSWSGEWKFREDWQLHASLPIVVYDWDGDGRPDITIGKGHDFGLYWWRQKKPADDGSTRWEKHTIDDTFSQPHSLHLADLDGDQQPELITGKRYYAHNGRDPGGQNQPCLYFYRWNTDNQSFDRSIIDRGTVGTGLQVRTGDLNGDGRTDIAVAGKSGTYLLFNHPSD